MFGIGMGEMVLILGIALVVIGPDRFPDFIKIALRTIRDFRGYVDDVKRDLSKELRPVQKEIEDITRLDSKLYAKDANHNVEHDDEKKEKPDL